MEMEKFKTSFSLVNSPETLQNNNINIGLISIELSTSSQSHVAGDFTPTQSEMLLSYPPHQAPPGSRASGHLTTG